MKSLALILFIITLYQLRLFQSMNVPPNNKLGLLEVAQCKVCLESFIYDFNFEKFTKDKENSDKIKNYLSQIANGNLVLNIEAVSKDVSMKYFFKNNDIQQVSNDCKVSIIGKDKDCDNKKFKICNIILNFTEKPCESKMSMTETSNFTNVPSLPNNMNNNSNNFKKEENSINNNLNDFGSNNQLEQLSKMLNQEADKFLGNGSKQNSNLVGFNNGYFNNNSNQYNDNKNNSYLHSSLIEVTQPIVNEVKTSQFNIKEPHQQWIAPKPIIFDNFQDNLGTQLKEISYLTNEIAKYESKLKVLKQQLANILDIAQNSYNVVQRTLSQISSFINQPTINNQEVQLNSNKFFPQPQPTEDDFDETNKFFK